MSKKNKHIGGSWAEYMKEKPAKEKKSYEQAHGRIRDRYWATDLTSVVRDGRKIRNYEDKVVCKFKYQYQAQQLLELLQEIEKDVE